ncbi:MAG TPA: acyl-CoA dehydrogenase family protein [Acidimicrobiales bacterium]|nr:acyl-CoA dehydrogenase family protein [Acidimicrobiales bacterium]
MAEPAPDLEAFRRRAARWLEDNAAGAPADYGPIMPPELRGPATAWQARMQAAGYGGIDWPAEHGGAGLTPQHRAVWSAECARAGVPAVLNMVGLVLAANAILAYGTDDQRRRHLPPTVRGEVVWCQLFSEPGAGSDLASLSTSAVADGDSYVVSGEKVWSSAARCSDMGILLARTDPDAPRHRGISMFLLDMTLPGVEVRPLRQMTGRSEFDQVFLDEVRVDAAELVGPLNAGWTVAMSALTDERSFIASGAASFGRRLDELSAGPMGTDGCERARRDLALSVLASGRALQLLARRQGAGSSTAASLVKLGLAEASVAMASVRSAGAGPGAMMADSPEAQAMCAAPGARLGGGTSEVQRTIIGERLLGLPREPRQDGR